MDYKEDIEKLKKELDRTEPFETLKYKIRPASYYKVQDSEDLSNPRFYKMVSELINNINEKIAEEQNQHTFSKYVFVDVSGYTIKMIEMVILILKEMGYKSIDYDYCDNILSFNWYKNDEDNT